MTNLDLQISYVDKKLKELIKKTYIILEETNSSETKKNLIRELGALENRRNLDIAFVGQYSSGKSTIISALTGNKDIKIDANVATDSISEYQWNNITIIDTPGILAGKVERHDEITKVALVKSDLIIYVITSQLFDDIIFENFIDLAYNQHFRDKILIVLNKMGMEAGEFNELKRNYLESIQSIFIERGYIFDFEIVFIDAADYIEGVKDNDEDFIEISNFSEFVTVMNKFVNKKGLIKKQFDSPLRLLKNSVSDIALQEVDNDLHQLIIQGENRIRSSKKSIQNDLRVKLHTLKSNIVERGQNLGSCIGEVDEMEFGVQEEGFNFNVKTLIDNTMNEIEQIIEDEEKKLMEEMEDFASKDVIVNFTKSLDSKLDFSNLSPNAAEKLQVSISKQKQILETLTRGGSEVLKNTINSGAKRAGLNAFSGSETHNIVKQVGGFFGKKFKPWEAVKITGKIGKVAKIAGPALSTLAIGLDLYSKHKTEKQIKEVQRTKKQFFETISSFASEIIEPIENSFNEYFKNSYDARLDLLSTQKMELVNLANQNSKFGEAIKKLDAEFIEFIEIIEKF